MEEICFRIVAGKKKKIVEYQYYSSASVMFLLGSLWLLLFGNMILSVLDDFFDFGRSF